jgi:hypothetical protein
MTKKLNSFTASQASTSTLPRLSFKRNQPKPEFREIWSLDFLATVISRRCGPAATSPRRPADRAHPHAGVRRARVTSPGDSARFCSAPALVASAWSICSDKGLGLTPSASALPSQCYCGPERNNWSRRLRRRKRPSDLAASLNHQGRTRRWSNDCPLQMRQSNFTSLAVTASRQR